jgi:hypothetical protein
MARVIAGCAAAIRYYIYAAKPHLTWMDKKLGFFVGAPGTHTSFFQLQWVSDAVLGCSGATMAALSLSVISPFVQYLIHI